jgi:hypothetical protein
LAKTNYQFEKRQRDLAKKRKQEEKRLRKLAAKEPAEGAGLETSPVLPQSEQSDAASAPAGNTPATES